MPWFIPLLVSLAITVVAYLIMPKPKGPKPGAVTDMDDPTADAGRPMPVLFGDMTVKGLNVLWFGDKSISNRKIKV